MPKDQVGIELDKQDTDEVFRQLDLVHEELTQVKNMLSLLLAQQNSAFKKAA